MSYLDYRLKKRMLKVTAWLIAMIITFMAGVYAGGQLQIEYEKAYIGRVIEKEHISERIENGERYDEAYYIVVEDNHGDYLRYSVSKDEYKQVGIKDLRRR